MSGSPEPPPALSQEHEVDRLVGLVGYQLRRSYFRSLQFFAAATAGLDITPIQYGILETVLESDVLAQRDIADRLGSAAQSVVPLIRDLEDRRLVKRVRSKADRRRHQLTLTKDGLDLLVELRERVTGIEADLVSGFAPGERSQLIDLLRRLGQDPPE